MWLTSATAVPGAVCGESPSRSSADQVLGVVPAAGCDARCRTRTRTAGRTPPAGWSPRPGSPVPADPCQAAAGQHEDVFDRPAASLAATFRRGATGIAGRGHAADTYVAWWPLAWSGGCLGGNARPSAVRLADDRQPDRDPPGGPRCGDHAPRGRARGHAGGRCRLVAAPAGAAAARALSREEIDRTAIAVADAEVPDAISMRRIAREHERRGDVAVLADLARKRNCSI